MTEKQKTEMIKVIQPALIFASLEEIGIKYVHNMHKWEVTLVDGCSRIFPDLVSALKGWKTAGTEVEEMVRALKVYHSIKKEGKCPFCCEPTTEDDFSDPEHLKEYKISGLCERCQDAIQEPAEHEVDFDNR